MANTANGTSDLKEKLGFTQEKMKGVEIKADKQKDYHRHEPLVVFLLSFLLK